MLSSRFSQTTLKGQVFRTYDDEYYGRDWSRRPHHDARNSGRWSDTPDRDTHTLPDAMSAILNRVRGVLAHG